MTMNVNLSPQLEAMVKAKVASGLYTPQEIKQDGRKREASRRAADQGGSRRREGLAKGLRSVPVGRYVIFSLAITGGIQIVRVLH